MHHPTTTKNPFTSVSLLCFRRFHYPSNRPFRKIPQHSLLVPPHFAWALSLFSLETIVRSKRNWKQCLCKIWGKTQSIMGFSEVAYYDYSKEATNRCKIRYIMPFFASHFPVISTVILIKPWNLTGCFALVFLSYWLGKGCNFEQKIMQFGN